MQGEAVDVLVVEDNESERKSIIENLRKLSSTLKIISVRDGDEAADFLLCRGDFVRRNERYQPRLILLDLRLPRGDGLDVLRRLRNIAEMHLIPVVVFTDSKRDADMRDCYENGANSFVAKPVDFEAFSEVVKEVGHYWLVRNQVPV